MKTQIDQSTPFLAFYDLLRIRGIYSEPEKREKLRRGFRRAMALAAVLVAFALPQRADARGNALPDTVTGRNAQGAATGTQPNYVVNGNTGTFSGAGTWTWGSGSTGFNVNGATVVLDGSGTFKFIDRSGAGSDITGEVRGQSANFWILNPNGVTFGSGATINVGGLLAAALSEDKVSSGFLLNDVGNGTIDLGGKSGSSYTVAIGKSLSNLPANAIVVNTTGMTGDGTISVAPASGGTITFRGVETGAGSEAAAANVAFEEDASVAGGAVKASGNVTGDFTQSGGTVEASEITGTLTQSGGTATANKIAALNQNAAGAVAKTAEITGVANQTAGTIDAGSATATLTVGAGSTLGAGTVNAGTVTVGAGSGALTLAGNQLGSKTINAGAVTLAGAAGQAYDVGGNISSVGTSGNAAGAVTVNKTGAGALTLGTINASSLDATASGNIAQSGVTTLSGTGDKHVALDAGTGTIDLSRGVSGAGTLTLKSNATAAGDITAAKIDATGKTFTQNGAGTISVSGADGIVASQVSQAYNGTEGGRSTIRADKIEADFVQTGSYAAVDANTENGILDIQGNVTQNADNGVIGSSSTEVRLGSWGKPLDQDKGTIDAGLLWIRESSTSAGDINAEQIRVRRSNGTWVNLTQDGSGTISVSGADGITTEFVRQTSTGTIRTDTVNGYSAGGGRVYQTGAATLRAYNPDNGLAIAHRLEQQHAGAVVGTDDENVKIGHFDQDAGTIHAATLTIEQDSAAAGNVVAGKITAADGITLTQDGAGTIKAASGGIELDVAVVQNAAGATIGSTDTSVKVDQAFTQTAGKIEAATLAFVKAGETYSLGGANNVKILTSVDPDDPADVPSPVGLDAVSINNGSNPLELKGVSTANGLTVSSAGAVTDSGSGVAGGTLKVVSSTGVTLDDTAELSVEGIVSSGNVKIEAATSLAQTGEIKSTGGDVGIATAAFTQNGNAVSGRNVTILGDGEGELSVDGNVTATGDILVKSAEGAVKTGAATLSSATGSVVLQGTSVETDGTTLGAATAGKGVGIQATAGDVTVKSGTTIVAPTVVLGASGDAVVETGVAMHKSDAAADAKKADLFVAAGGNVDVKLSNAAKPTDNVTIVSGALADDPNGTTVELASFAYKTDGDIGFTFTGSKLAVESTDGNVDITATGDELTVVDASSAAGGASVSAKNVADAADDPVEIKVGADDAGSQPKGLVAAADGKSVKLTASGDVTVEGVITSSDAPTIALADGKSFAVANRGVVQSLDGDVSVATTGTGTIDVERGGTVQAANGAVTLATAGGATTVAGTVQAGGGAVDIESGDALTVSGTVRDFMTVEGAEKTSSGGVTLSSGNGKNATISGTVASRGDSAITAAGNLSQTGGTIASDGKLDLTATAGSVNQTGGSVTAAGAATAKAESGSVALAQAGNDFQNGLEATAKNAVNVRDANDLEVSVSGDTTGNVRLRAGATLDVTSGIDAGGTATLLSGGHMDAQGVKAAGAVQATADSGGATFAGAMEGSSVAATATGGALQTQVVTATGGDATLRGASVTTGGDVTARRGNAAIAATAGRADVGGAVDARNVTVDATRGVTLDGATTATGTTAVRTTGGAIEINADATAPTAVYRAENGNVTIKPGTTVSGDALGIRGNTIDNQGTFSGVDTLALVTGSGAATYDDDTIPTGVANLGLQAGGDLTVDVSGALTANGANVTTEAGNANRTVAANGIVSTGGEVDVTAGGAVTAASIAGAGGTTVDAAGQQVNVAGDLGDGGATAVTAGGLQSGRLVAGEGGAQLAVGGAANVGTLDVDGNLGGQVNGQFTTAGGDTGTIGQGGAFQANGGFQQNGALNTGAMTVQTGAYAMNGALNAGGAAVNITAGGGIQGGGNTLTAGALTLAGGNVGGTAGTAGNALQVNTANIVSVTGGNVYLVDTAAGPVAIALIQANAGDVGLEIQGAEVQGGGTISAPNGNITIRTNARFGDLDNPVTVAYGGTLTVEGVEAPLLHIVVTGDIDPLEVYYNANGFAIWQNPAGGYQIVGAGPEKTRLINRALAFTVNTPELKSKQGIFGDPAMLHTKMNVAESRPGANMDLLALSTASYQDTWETLVGDKAEALAEWQPSVDFSEGSPLFSKMDALRSEIELQPEIMALGASRVAPPAETPAEGGETPAAAAE